jgi:hypothetical protein
MELISPSGRRKERLFVWPGQTKSEAPGIALPGQPLHPAQLFLGPLNVWRGEPGNAQSPY